MYSPEGVPKAIAKRLPIYHQCLLKMRKQGKNTISSKELGKELGLEATMIRKDLAYFGELGKRGVGYDVELLFRTIRQVLNLDQHWKVVLIGNGKMASAVVEYNCLYGKNFRIVGVFAPGPVPAGKMLEHLPVQPLSELKKFVENEEIKLAILATRVQEAQEAVDQIAKSGIKAILNVSPVNLSLPDNIIEQRIDLTWNLQTLACHLE
ncbi:redox-sensing transcriptional repressor Rex [Desulfofalx alkaliphila]|uniref:redox-sensing transcriptional repressor Rex n=1 Tax=Desulfofalx alkaliphila TaxID=105483 RepID=UPI0004E26665|nr:redox-sensing transcriptional repressor Rex [Desulfofalx alkaliphila]